MFKIKTGLRQGVLVAAACFMPCAAMAWDPYEADLYGRYTLTVSTGGALAAGEDAVTVARLGDSVVRLKLSPFGDNQVKAELFVYAEQGGAGDKSLKLTAKPVMVGLAGRPMEFSIGGANGNPVLKFQVTPLLKTADYSGPQLDDEVLAKTDAVFNGALDARATYWAWRIAQKKDAPYDEVVRNSSAWDVFPATREKFWLKTGELIATGQAPKPTSEEKRALKAADKRLAALTADEPRYPQALKDRIKAVDQLMQGMLELDAMYWAWRIVHDKDVTYDELLGHSRNWVASRAQNRRFFAALKRILDAGQARPLTSAEDLVYSGTIDKAKTAGL